MLQKMEWKKYWHRGAVLLMLLLLLSTGRAVFAQTEPVLTDYANSVQVDLDADAEGTELPQYVENGQSLFFRLQIQNFKSKELIAYLQANPGQDFTIPLDFIGHITGNYPAEIEPADFDNVAISNEKPLFRWWIDKDNDVIRIRFDEEWIANADENNTTVNDVSLSFTGMLNVTDKGDDGKIVFSAAGETFPLQMKAGYTLEKTAGVPYYSTDASSYLTDYNVILTLDQNMSISDNASADLYTAALTLVDTVEAAGALRGEIYGNVIVTSPDGETADAILSTAGTANTLTISSPDQILKKGTYTFTYKMKIQPEAAADKLAGYTDAQKTNIVELKENGASLTTPLTATATIAWDNVTVERFKIDKTAFTDGGSNYGGVYPDETNEKYYIDYRVVVYIREPVQTFTVTDAPQYGFTFRPDVPITLEGVDTDENYWTNDINTAVLSDVDATFTTETQQLPLGDNGANVDCQVITITAPEGQLLAPGAYHLRIPADVTKSVINANGQIDPKTFSNVAYLTSVDGEPTKEYKEYEQTIPNYTTPSKAGGYEVDPDTGEFLFYNGKPVIRWDVWFGWDFYNIATFTDTMTGMELLVNDEYPFDIHSFTDGDTHKEKLASIKSIADTNYLDFDDTRTGFTFSTKNLATNADGTPVKLYKLVYFTTPLDDNSTIGYQSTGLKNGYTITYTDPFGNSTGVGPVEVEPVTTFRARLYVKKAHVIELNDYLTRWKITCDNTENKVPFARLDNLTIIDHIPDEELPIGEVTIHYNDAWPITVEMVCGNDEKVTLVEGTHYTIAKQHADFDFGENGKYGFAVVMNMEKLAEALASAGSDYFKTIDVICYLENEKQPSGINYRIKNDGWIYYSNQGQALVEGINAFYDRGFATKEKLEPLYGDYYDPAAGRNFTVCSVAGRADQSFIGGYDDDPNNGDGEEEILWKIYLGAREFGTSSGPITVTVTDTLSDNQVFPTYPGKELKDLFLIEAEDNPGYIILPDSVTLSGNTFTLTFTIPGNGWAGGNKDKSKDLYITYHTVLKKEVIQEALDAAAKDADTIVVEYSNTASVSWNGDSNTIPTSRGSHGFNASMLDKKALFLQSSGSKVNYTIEMNPYRLDLADGDVIQLEDNMGEGKNVFTYVASSFKLVNLDTGLQMKPSSAASATTYVLTMKEDGKGFTLDVPDNTSMKLTYQVKTTQPVGTKDVTLVNNASLAGRKPQEKAITFDVTSAYQSGSFTVASNEVGIRLIKISSEGADSDSPIFLPGAEFVVTELDPSTFEQIGNAQNLFTNENGIIEFKQVLNSIKIYTFREKTAPSGYRLDAVPWQWCYVMLPNGETISDNELGRLKTATGMEVTVIPAGSYVEEVITNTPRPGSVQFSGTKTIDGRNMTANDVFTFEITENGTNNKWTVQNDSTGKINYPEIEYTSADVGEHVYLISETETDINGITIDTKTYTVTVVVSDNGDGTLGIQTSGDDYTKLDFENKYEATGSAQFEGTKTLTGATLSADDFTFEIKDADGKTLSTVKNGADGKIIFDSIAYTLADVGTHTYTVKEVNDGKAGYTYDDKEYEIVVTVADAGDGTLIVTYTVNGTANGAITFANEYVASGSVQFEGTKTLTGATLAADQFSFTLSDEDENVIETVTNEADGKFNFSAINYTLADVGTHTYTVKEVNGGLAGYTYDTTEYEILVTVADAGDGTLNVTYTVNGTANGAITFANEYTATGSVQFEGTKTLTGATLTDHQFRFTLTGEGVNKTTTNDADGKFRFAAINYTLADVGTHTYIVKELNDGRTGYTYDSTEYQIVVTVADAGDGTLNVTYTVNGTANGAITFANAYVASGRVQFGGTKTLTGATLKANQFSFILSDEDENVIETVTNNASGIFRFAEIVYTLADVGTHTYTVKEVNDGLAGYTYDTTEYEILVTVADAGDGTLNVTYTVNGTANGAITFANEYAALGRVQFGGTKTLTGATLAADQFSFTLSDEDENVIETVTNEADGKFNFSAINYTLADVGTHTYTVKEVNGGLAGYTYDTTEYEILVTVADAGDGTLNVTYTVNGTANGAITFANEYTATGSVQFEGTKTLTGATLAADQFSFTLSDEDENVIETVTNDADGKFSFSEINYTLADVGTHTYTVKEVNDGKAGYTYDNKEYEIVVTVADAGDGTLKVTYTVNGTANGAITFANEYTATGSVQFEGTKTLNGATLAAGQFSFTLTGEGVNETVTNDADGKFRFSAINYTLADVGTHTYTVKEVNDGKAGYTYDNKEYEIVVTVEDAGDGTLNVTYTVNGTANGAITFANEYAATGSVQFEGTKTLTGATLAANQFSFTLTGEGVNETVTNGADGKFSFSEINYTLADVGTHTYTVKELNDGRTGYTYDSTEYQIVVTVTDAGDGTLNVTYTVNGTANGAITFANEYAATGSVQFEGTKTLTGATLKANQFSFTLSDEDENVIETVTNDADGKFSFSEIAYTLEDVGTHTYTVKEVNDGKAGYTYDDKEYEIIVTVADAGDGTLNVTYTVNGTANGAITFANEYAAAGSVQFEGTKTLTGATLAANQFSFTLTGEGVNETVTNDADGKFSFSAINYTLADVGTHTYTVKEVNGGKTGYIYDGTEYEIVVTVADAGDGTLKVTYTVNGTANGAITFANKYVAAGGVQFEGIKTLTGSELKEGQFSFALIGEGVNETVTNDADGKFRFAAIAYTLEDVGTHTYTVKEVNDGKAGYTYDTTEYEIVVTVADAGDGTLNVTYTVNGTANGAITFANEYAAAGSVQFEGTKTLTGATLAADQFSFTLTGEGVNETVTNDADGKFRFAAIAYTLEDVGTHIYTVKEVNDGKAGYTYDNMEYVIIVTVADAGDGTLTVTYTVNGTANGAIIFANKYVAGGSTPTPTPAPTPTSTPTPIPAPLDDIPKTGDESHVELWLFLMIVSGIGCLMILQRRKED